MSTLSPRPLLPTFLQSINALLAALVLPFTIDHPTDLTPSLLLAVFESLISARLPIPASVRQSRTRDAKTRAMLVLLGVLECDVLRGGTSNDSEHSIVASNADDSALGGAGGVSVDGWVDEIGLGEVDPERLADGGWDETIFVGELLCWLARRKGVLPRTKSSHRPSHSHSLYLNHHSYGTEDDEHEGDTTDFSTSLLLRPSSAQKPRSPRPPSPSPSVDDADPDPDSSAFSYITDIPRHPLVYSPEHSLTMSATTGTNLSIRARSVSSRTSVSNIHDDPDEPGEMLHDTVQLYDSLQLIHDAEEDDDQPPTFRPRCIHELEDPSYIRALAGPSSSFDQSTSRDHHYENADERHEEDNDDPYAPCTPTPRRVRLTGWIDAVDAATELNQFAASHSHSRSRTLNTTAGPGPGPPSQSLSQPQSHMNARTSGLTKSSPRLNTKLSPRLRPISSKARTPLRVSSSPSPSPPPSPPLPTSSKHLPACSSLSPPPSPPSSPAHSDPPFDVSFWSLNNTSTPAKFRLPRRPQSTTPRHETPYGSVDGRTQVGNVETIIGPDRPHRHDRSPSYTPSPPSFTTSGSLRSGSSGTRIGTIGPAGSKTRLDAATPPATATSRKKTSPSPTSANMGTSPPLGSTATTNTLLTERARLLTELAALKRARAAGLSIATVSSIGTESGNDVGTGGGDNGVIRRRVGVGVRS